jgi:hypothetical protein
MNATNTNRYRTVSLVALALVTAFLSAPRVNRGEP